MNDLETDVFRIIFEAPVIGLTELRKPDQCAGIQILVVVWVPADTYLYSILEHATATLFVPVRY